MTSSSKNAPSNGQLYIVATPIGNLNDITRRAIDILSEADIIACEDTRQTKKLCNAFHITTKLFSYYREQEQKKSDILVEMLVQGKVVALVSDAGTPGLSDPGAILVNKARNKGISIYAVAGPSALAAALSVAGLTKDGFFFGGFLPAKASDKKRLLKSLAPLSWPLIFYESPHRICASLNDIKDILGDREGLLLRELTKIHEECQQGRLSSLIEYVSGGIKGEIVLLVQGAVEQVAEKPENLEELVRWYKNVQKASVKDTVRSISNDLDLPRTKVYKEVLALWNT